jgi:hypothetical protein
VIKYLGVLTLTKGDCGLTRKERAGISRSSIIADSRPASSAARLTVSSSDRDQLFAASKAVPYVSLARMVILQVKFKLWICWIELRQSACF